MSTRTALLLTGVLAVGWLHAACDSVPDVRFEDPDGAAAADSGAPGDAASEVGPADAGHSADVQVARMCPTLPPPNATGCCGDVPCVGRNCDTQCLKCPAGCGTGGTYCCTEARGRCIAPGDRCD